MIPKLYNWRVRTGKTHRFSDEFFHCVGCVVMRTWSVLMVSVMTTVTQQSMMLDWVNVGTDSNHSTVKVNVKMLMLTIVLTALAPQANYKQLNKYSSNHMLNVFLKLK